MCWGTLRLHYPREREGERERWKDSPLPWEPLSFVFFPPSIAVVLVACVCESRSGSAGQSNRPQQPSGHIFVKMSGGFDSLPFTSPPPPHSLTCQSLLLSSTRQVAARVFFFFFFSFDSSLFLWVTHAGQLLQGYANLCCHSSWRSVCHYRHHLFLPLFLSLPPVISVYIYIFLVFLLCCLSFALFLTRLPLWFMLSGWYIRLNASHSFLPSLSRSLFSLSYWCCHVGLLMYSGLSLTDPPTAQCSLCIASCASAA